MSTQSGCLHCVSGPVCSGLCIQLGGPRVCWHTGSVLSPWHFVPGMFAQHCVPCTSPRGCAYYGLALHAHCCILTVCVWHGAPALFSWPCGSRVLLLHYVPGVVWVELHGWCVCGWCVTQPCELSVVLLECLARSACWCVCGMCLASSV